MDPHQFYDLLCCPSCRGELALAEGQDEFSCAPCGHTYPIVDGIPVLFPTDVKSKMDELFGRYWDSPDKADLYDTKVEGDESLFGVYNHESEMYALTRYYDPANLDLVLDAGCGNGRFMETLPDSAVKVGLDASLNLLRRVKRRGRGDFLVCAELEHLPFKEGRFGTVISCRVLQHLRRQEEAVHEMARVVRDSGDVILELYNTWNLKTIYKNIRMTGTLRKVLNAPFRAVFKSMSPFGPWGLGYDNYNGWFQVKRWMKRAGLTHVGGRGAGWGYFKYFFQPFYISAFMANHAPGFAKKYYAASFAAERVLGGLIPFRYSMEKTVLLATKGDRSARSGLASRVGAKLHQTYRTSDYGNALAVAEKRAEADKPRDDVSDNRFHLEAALGWLKRAQDATPDRGVSRAFAAAWNPHFKAAGWQPSYPETTGYIIPTFYDCVRLLGDEELRRRAVEMADWEIEVQMDSGAVMGGTVNNPPTPAVFNTGQVMLGWLRAHEETNDRRYAEALKRAADFLIAMQSEDGAWRKGNSRYATDTPATYNARVGWAMILYGKAADEPAALESGRKNLQYTMAQQQDNGWFASNCISDPANPLLHTICYAMEGLLGGYDALGSEELLERTRLAVEPLMDATRDDGFVPGRFDREWQPSPEWSCLTGSAQLAGILLRLYGATREERYRTTARSILRFLKWTQNCSTDEGGLRGGIKGSYPFDGGYGRYEVLNWATKFYVDALLLDETT